MPPVIRAEIGYRGNLKRRMERANKAGSRAAVIVGDTIALKDLDTGEQVDTDISGLAALLTR